jgi:hypothetical protein
MRSIDGSCNNSFIWTASKEIDTYQDQKEVNEYLEQAHAEHKKTSKDQEDPSSKEGNNSSSDEGESSNSNSGEGESRNSSSGEGESRKSNSGEGESSYSKTISDDVIDHTGSLANTDKKGSNYYDELSTRQK